MSKEAANTSRTFTTVVVKVLIFFRLFLVLLFVGYFCCLKFIAGNETTKLADLATKCAPRYFAGAYQMYCIRNSTSLKENLFWGGGMVKIFKLRFLLQLVVLYSQICFYFSRSFVSKIFFFIQIK